MFIQAKVAKKSYVSVFENRVHKVNNVRIYVKMLANTLLTNCVYHLYHNVHILLVLTRLIFASLTHYIIHKIDGIVKIDEKSSIKRFESPIEDEVVKRVIEVD